MFRYVEERLETVGLDLTYHLAPWDRPVFRGNTAVISSICVKPGMDVDQAFDEFRDWCKYNEVKLVCCRLPHDQLVESGFLEAAGFRFIELNYLPTIVGLDRFSDDPDISVRPAMSAEAAELSSYAEQTFNTGRLHIDPQVGPEIGRRRYAAWVVNAFQNPRQQVFTCVQAQRIIAYFVLEQPTATSRFLSLCSLTPGLAGQGLGRRVIQAILMFCHRQGAVEVSTSISSLNIPIFNLFTSMGFRFPAPLITLHWCPFGPIERPW